MIDWDGIKPGDIAIYRNGGRSELIRVNKLDARGYVVTFADGYYSNFSRDGRMMFPRPGPFDIIAIEKAPEPVQIEFKVRVNRDLVFVISNDPSHRITFNLINGDPDCASVAMEKL